MTLYASLVAFEKDSCGYTTYVFKVLDSKMAKESPYIMCTRYPNWNHRPIKIGEEGFLTFTEITAGKDTWFNGESQVFYRYNAVRFEKFVEKPTTNKLTNYIM